MKGPARYRKRGRLGLTLGTALAALVGAAVAYADNVESDGDGVTPITNQDMSFGSISCSTPTSKSALIAISRNGAAGSPNVFKDGSTVTILSVTGAGLSATLGVPNTITLPANWVCRPTTP